MTLLDLLDRPIAFHRPLVTVTGSVHASLILSQAIYWSRRTIDKDGWFYKRRDEWRDETGLSRWEQETSRKALRKSGFWEERPDRLNHRLYYRVNIPELSRRLKSHLREGGNGGVGEDGFPPSTISKTTSETTSKEAAPLALNLNGAKGRKKFTPPTLKEIQVQCSIISLDIREAKKFLDWHESRGWKVGRMPMVSWVSALNTWKSHHEERNGSNGKNGQHSTGDPAGWQEWLAKHPEYHEICAGKKFSACREFIRNEFIADKKAVKA